MDHRTLSPSQNNVPVALDRPLTNYSNGFAQEFHLTSAFHAIGNLITYLIF